MTVVRLRLLDEVTWDGRPVAGDRSHGLLAVLAASAGRAVTEGDLVAAVWGPDDRPAQPAKALQVVVSRTRAQTSRELVVRVERGYRLGVDDTVVDATRLRGLVRDAGRAEGAGDPVRAREWAHAALDIVVANPGEEPAPVEDLRAAARLHHATAAALAGRAASAMGEHVEALGLLEGVPDPDETTLVSLLRSEAAVHGAPAALERYGRHRASVRDRLGVDPGPSLQALHAELLAADNPVREGLRFETTSLVGRDDDLRALRALVSESRVTSILGPGGLGKTRLAHLLGRAAEQPVVHFVELVGVAAPDDVVGEVGSALGVRDSVSGRRALTPEQRHDVRSRIAQQLDTAPTLLVLDNCEHVVGAVADLVAFLVATVPGLRVVTTTRAPLAIAAERVFALGQLSDDAALDLFRQRALAARPGTLLADDAVRRVVRRLDGLPLAIELAAAKVRAMSVADIDRRLDDRFALLRGTDRSAPDRHRTLMAVIDWSWHLLGTSERRALSLLALFHDGFGLDAAEHLLGSEALAAVESLVSQSLLTVREGDGTLRYRMLETVREFGRQQLGADEPAARAALRDWAVTLCLDTLEHVYGPDQVALVRRLTLDENNLADILREALADSDPATVAILIATLGLVWTIKGEHARIVAMTGAVDAVFDGWTPPEDLVELTARACGVMVMNTAVAELTQPVVCQALLTTYADRVVDPHTRALHAVLAAVQADADGGDESPGRALLLLVEHAERHTAMLALAWVGHWHENSGDTLAAVTAGVRALELWRTEDGLWTRALMQTQLAGLHAQTGDLVEAGRLAHAALDVLDALEAHDDATQLRSVLATGEIEAGRLDAAERILDRMTAPDGGFGAVNVVGTTRAELALARGDVGPGLAIYDEAVESARNLRFPGLQVGAGREPWTLFVESAALTAHARFDPAADAGARSLRGTVAAKLDAILRPDVTRIDYPVTGCMFFALAAWELAHGDADAAVAGAAIAERFGYSRYLPSLSWTWMRAALDAARPGALDAQLASYAERRGPAVLGEARVVAARFLGVGG